MKPECTSFLYYVYPNKKIEKAHTFRFSEIQFTLFPSIVAEHGIRRVGDTEEWRKFVGYASRLEFVLSGTVDPSETLARADDLVTSLCELVSFDTPIIWQRLSIRLKAEGAVRSSTGFPPASDEKSDVDWHLSRYAEEDLLQKYAPFHEVIYTYLGAQRSLLFLGYLGFCRALEGLFPDLPKHNSKEFERGLIKDPDFITIFNRLTTGPSSGFYAYRQVSQGLEVTSIEKMTHEIIVIRNSLAAHFGNHNLALRKKNERIRSYRFFLSALVREGIYLRCWGKEEPNFNQSFKYI